MIGYPPSSIFFKCYKNLLTYTNNGDTYYHSIEISLLKGLISGRDPFAKKCSLRPVIVSVDKKTVGICLLIRPPDSNKVTIGFFEAIRGYEQKVAEECLDAARKFARKVSAEIVIAGMNGHLSYGAGYLLDNYDSPPAFGTPFNPSGYPRAWEKLYPAVTHRFHSCILIAQNSPLVQGFWIVSIKNLK